MLIECVYEMFRILALLFSSSCSIQIFTLNSQFVTEIKAQNHHQATFLAHVMFLSGWNETMIVRMEVRWSYIVPTSQIFSEKSLTLVEVKLVKVSLHLIITGLSNCINIASWNIKLLIALHVAILTKVTSIIFIAK